MVHRHYKFLKSVFRAVCYLELINVVVNAENVSMTSTGNADPLSSHVLDISTGRPAAGVTIILAKKDGFGWHKISEQLTNEEGRVKNIISGEMFTVGVYKLLFNTCSYYHAQGQTTFFPRIEIIFEIENPNEHYHVPIVLSPSGYSNYRGS